MRETCCCCIPLRASLIILCPLTLLFSIGAAALLVWYLHQSGSTLPKLTQALAGLYTGLQILLAITSLIGFVGTIKRQASMVKVYAVVLLLTWLLGLGLGLGHIVDVWVIHRKDMLQNCMDKQAQKEGGIGENEDAEAVQRLTQWSCNLKFKVLNSLFVVLWLLFHLVTLYYIFVPFRTAKFFRTEFEDPLTSTYQYPSGAPGGRGSGSSANGSASQQDKTKYMSGSSSSSTLATTTTRDSKTRAMILGQAERPRKGSAGSDTGNANAAPEFAEKDKKTASGMTDVPLTGAGTQEYVTRYASRGSLDPATPTTWNQRAGDMGNGKNLNLASALRKSASGEDMNKRESEDTTPRWGMH